MEEDYPRSLQELERRFATEAACLAYLAALRWPAGFVCPACGGTLAWETTRGLRHCRQCGKQTSVTARTLFDRLVQHALLVDPVPAKVLRAARPAAVDDDIDTLDA